VGHAHDDLGDIGVGCRADQGVEHRHDHVVALDREPLLAQKCLVKELLEGVDPGQLLEES
jgi:hypothetical protein